MAVTQNEYTGNGSTTTYSFTFPYLQTTDVKVKLDGVTQATTAYTFPTATTVQMNSAPGNNVKVLIYRNTGNDNKKATFYPGSAIKAEDLNDDFDQILYTAQEIDNNAMTTLGDDTMIGNLQMGENQLVFEGATADAHETSIGVVDPTADRTINFPNVSGTVITTGDTGTVNSTILAANSVDSSELVDGSIDTSHIGDLQVTTAKIANDAVTGAKIADDQIDSEHLAADSIDAEHYAAGSVDATALASNAVTTVKINADAITGAKIADDQINSEHYVDGSIDTAHIADDQITNAKIATDAVNADSIVANAVGSSELADNAVDTAAIADDAVTSAKIAANAVTTSELADAELTTLAGMQSGTASILASGTALAATTTEINSICDGKTVQTTISDTDASYPTSGAVVDYVAAQIAPLGGLEVIANEDSFPTQPSSGVVISIADAGGIVVNGSGVSTTARTSGNGSDNVTINGFPSTLYSTTLTDNMGLLVSSTGSSNTYTYHKLLGKESDIKTLSDDINDFNARYRIASSAPSSNNDDGDLYFDTTSKKMKVYNAGTSQWDDVAQSSSSHIVTLSESFNGSLTDFTMSTAATDAQSTIVSINGVVQKPNAGTSTPAEGFAISGNTLKLSNAPATGSTYFIVVLGDTVSIGTPSDNTVSTAKIQNLAVTTDKIAADAVTGAKIADDAVGAEHIEVLDANLQLADSVKIQIGTGNDLEIYHNSNNSYIQDTGTGNLHLTSNGTAVSIDKGTSENMAVFNVDGTVDLYHDGVKTFNTIANGIQVRGTEGVEGHIYLYADEGDDYADLWLVQADQAVSGFYIRNKASGSWEHNIKCFGNGAVELYWDNVLRAQTTNVGLHVTDILSVPDNGKLRCGNGDDLEIFHNGTDSRITNTTGGLYIDTPDLYIRSDGGSEDAIQVFANGAVKLFHNGTKKLETNANGVNMSGSMYFPDNEIAGFGDVSNPDLRILHNGTDSWISNKTGNLGIKTTTAGHISIKTNDEYGIFCSYNGGISLYYDDVKKLETVSHGTIIYGTGEVQGNVANNYVNHTFNDGNSNTRYGSYIKCGKDDASGTNYALGVSDGDGGTQGYLTFSGGTLALDPFTAAHPCIVPDADNPSDDSMAYPYGTLLETITIEYKKKKDGSDTERGILYKVQKTQSANSKKVLGAYAGSLNNSPDNYTNMHHVYVLGDGHILVNNAGGNIEVGDGICSSATAGIGQKATANPSMIIGIAQEAITFTGSETKLVAVQYGLQQFIPWT